MSKPAERRPIVRLALSRAEVALAIGVSIGSIDTMVTEGVLPKPRRWHSRKLWLVSEIEAHLNDWPIDGESEWNAEAELNKVIGSYAAVKEVKGAGGYTIPASKDDPLHQYYEDIGFDPRTMDQEDMRRLTAAEKARWAGSIPGTPLNKREISVLKQFPNYPAGTLINGNALKGAGWQTAEMLQARGFLEIVYEPGEQPRVKGHLITVEGMAAAAKLTS